jgi:acetoin utilization protein AcuC
MTNNKTTKETMNDYTPMPLQIAYTDDYLNWNLGAGDGSHPTRPIRAKIATEQLLDEYGVLVEIIDPEVRELDRMRLESVHSPKYVSEVIDSGLADDWAGKSALNAWTAQQMFAGTARLTENMIDGEVKVGFNPQGAKHHAHYNHSSGFCVFNDMAWSALEFAEAGLKPLYIDWDAHAGDGVQALLKDTDIPTMSIHGTGIFPYGENNHHPKKFGKKHTWHNVDKNFYNWNLEQGSGDYEFLRALDDVEKLVADYRPDVILLATGADAHYADNWGLKYTVEGYVEGARRVADMANEYANGRVLIGGAGGYKAMSWTPLVWSSVVGTIYEGVS